MRARRRAIYLALRFGMLTVAAAIAVPADVQGFSALHGDDAAALAIAFALVALLLRINVPLTFRASVRRRNLDPGRLTMQVPILVTIASVYGCSAAAAIALLAYPAAIPADGRSRFLRRVLDGGSAAFFWLCTGAVASALHLRQPTLSLTGYGTFLALYTCSIIVYLYALWLPIRALTHNVLLVRLWRDLTRDTRRFTFTLLLVSWGFVCTVVWLRTGITLGLATFGPLPFIAAAMRAQHTQRQEIHRLRLARGAVQAMLRARDPVPQMNSLLESLHTPSSEETLQIYGAIVPDEERFAPLATLGPALSAEQMESARHALSELQHNDVPSITIRTRLSVLNAYGVRTVRDQLLGALIVHRPPRSAGLLDRRRFKQAAAELAPLLRDFRAIAVTQSAAALDALTGLPNRRTIMELLRDRIEQVSVGNPCAVLIIDIDRFKTINDTLGHQAGDTCLRAVGQIIARNIRSLDRAGRIGGEEFVILMPDTSSEMARAAAERLRAAIELAEIRHASGEAVTASIGIAVASVSDTVDSLLARADRALYQAKRQGRNRVIEISA